MRLRPLKRWLLTRNVNGPIVACIQKPITLLGKPLKTARQQMPGRYYTCSLYIACIHYAVNWGAI